MKKQLMPLLLAILSAPLFAAEHYTEARITQIETGPTTVVFFVQVVSGDAFPTGNAGSNEPVTKSYVYLASSAEDVAARKHMLSNAFMALTKNSLVRFRWEDSGSTGAYVVTMLVRS